MSVNLLIKCKARSLPLGHFRTGSRSIHQLPSSLPVVSVTPLLLLLRLTTVETRRCCCCSCCCCCCGLLLLLRLTTVETRRCCCCCCWSCCCCALSNPTFVVAQIDNCWNKEMHFFTRARFPLGGPCFNYSIVKYRPLPKFTQKQLLFNGMRKTAFSCSTACSPCSMSGQTRNVDEAP